MAPASPDRAPPDGLDDDTEDEAPPRRRRLLPLVVLFGALLAGAPLLDGVGDRRDLVIRLDAPADVTAISVLVRDGDDALWGTERQFARGSAPPHLRRTLPLPAGRYHLVVSLVERGQPRRIERHFDVAEAASEVVIPIGSAPP